MCVTWCLSLQESASALAEGPALEGSSLAESLRAAAEAAVSQTGFTYDESTGLYFDHSTGFYYDSVSISDLPNTALLGFQLPDSKK